MFGLCKSLLYGKMFKRLNLILPEKSFYKFLLSKLYGLPIIMFLFATLSYSQVSLEVHPGFLVQTKNNVSVTIDGNLLEEGTGYFSGTISSGVRQNINFFAGLTLSNNVYGIINRITGKSYSKGNGEITNFKRYYEITNKNGNGIMTDISIEFIGSGKHNETNGISPPYYIYRYSNNWKGYGEGSSNSPVTAQNVKIPSGLTDWIISDNSGIVSVENQNELPTEFKLYQNYPNPFNPVTTIKYSIPTTPLNPPFTKGGKTVGVVTLKVYNLLGEKIATLVNEKQQPRIYKVEFNAKDLPTGIYIYQLRAGSFVDSKKLILVK